MKLSRKMAILSLSAILGLTSLAGCTPDGSVSPTVEPTHSEEASPTPTVTPTFTPAPSDNPDIIPAEAHYVIKDGKSCITFVYAEKATDRLKNGFKEIQDYLQEKSGVYVQCKTDAQLSKIPNEKFFVGNTTKSNISLLNNDVTWYDCLLTQTSDGIVAMAYTQGGVLNAMEYFKNSLIFANNNKDVYVMPDVFKLYERNNIPEMEHAFKEFTISGYGTPTFSAADPDKWNEQDWKTYQSIIDFGVTNISIDGWTGIPANSSVEDTRKFIEKFYEAGITTRYYFSWNLEMRDKYVDDGKNYSDHGTYVELENNIKDVIKNYGDMEAITEWGFWDEPEGHNSYLFCRLVLDLFDQYDPIADRRVYINMGPMAHYDDYLNAYDDLALTADPDYYCYDRYPFFYNEDGQPQMTDTYWYANLELNRDYALDFGKDTGIIVGAIVVGNDPRRSEMTQEYMTWQVNTMLAYHHRYLEHFVFYSGHGHGLYTNENDPTFRWYFAQNANKYAMTVGTMLLDKRLDAVFHLQNADGTYSPQTVTYSGFRNAGDVTGCDAFLSFFDDGTLIITDKRSAPADGGDHDITLSGLKGDIEWFNADTNAWEDISSCSAATVSENGLTLTLKMATQYIVREK